MNSTTKKDVLNISETEQPLPKAKGDPWFTLLEPLMEGDHHRCAAWKDEVQNLLIFAGLFSAVVTAFLMESYKTLREDPLETAVVLLNKIVVNGTGLGASAALPSSSHFSPKASDVRINALWFLSLIISLSTVLIGILSLQWLREYQRPRGDHSPRILLSLFQMHEEALERWCLPQVFSGLPLLLQFGLVLFFCGMIDFLYHLNVAVATPSAIAMGLTILFLVLSTILPSFQAFTLLFPRRAGSDKPRAPCAYKSPQSWLFHRFLVTSILLFHRCLVKSVSLCVKPSRLPEIGPGLNRFVLVRKEIVAEEMVAGPWPPDVTQLTRNIRMGVWCPKSHPTEMMIWKTKGISWSDHGIAWLFQRDIDRMCMHKKTAPLARSAFLTEAVPLHDTVNVLLRRSEIATRSPRRTIQLIAAYQCFEQVFGLTIRNKLILAPRENLYQVYVHSLLATHWQGLPMCVLATSPNIDSPEAINKVFRDDFLHAVQTNFVLTVRFPLEAKRYVVERCLHLTDWMFSHKPRRIDDDFRTSRKLPIQWLADQIAQFTIANDDFPDVQSQVVDLLAPFFSFAMEFRPSEEELGTTTHTTIYTCKFLVASSKIIQFRPNKTVDSAHDHVLASLAAKLQSSSFSLSSSSSGEPSSNNSHSEPSSQSQSPIYLLVVATIYTHAVHCSSVLSNTEVFRELRAILRVCLVKARKDAQCWAYLFKLADCLAIGDKLQKALEALDGERGSTTSDEPVELLDEDRLEEVVIV